MISDVPLYIIGLSKNEPVGEFIKSKFRDTLEKSKKTLPEIIEAKISVKSQNSDGTRTHYDVTSTIITSKNQFIYTESGWDLLKIIDKLCSKLEGEIPKHDNLRQTESIRKKDCV